MSDRYHYVLKLLHPCVIEGAQELPALAALPRFSSEENACKYARVMRAWAPSALLNVESVLSWIAMKEQGALPEHLDPESLMPVFVPVRCDGALPDGDRLRESRWLSMGDRLRDGGVDCAWNHGLELWRVVTGALSRLAEASCLSGRLRRHVVRNVIAYAKLGVEDAEDVAVLSTVSASPVDVMNFCANDLRGRDAALRDLADCVTSLRRGVPFRPPWFLYPSSDGAHLRAAAILGMEPVDDDEARERMMEPGGPHAIYRRRNGEILVICSLDDGTEIMVSDSARSPCSGVVREMGGRN